MTGVDTNLLVRFYAGDDPAQTPIALRAMQASAPLFVAKTVLLELFWVLSSVHETPRTRLIAVLRHLLAFELFEIEDEPSVVSAVDSYEKGLDFPDALHLASSARCDAFLTFDAGLARRARRLKLKPECVVPKA